MTEVDVPSPAPYYRFDRFELRPAERALLADGVPVKLGGRAFDMLVALVERCDRVVGKHELMDLVWPKLVVEENNLQAQVVALRKLLGPAAIATVPGRGYRLTLAVEALGAPPVVAVASQQHPSATAPTSAPPPIRHNLPRSMESLIGRGNELAQVRALIDAHRLVTVTGPGGVGKSRLVIDAAWASVDRFANGVWLVELAALADPALVPSAVTNALRIAVAPSEDPLAALTRQLGDQRLLIVLDNCEHVVDAVASVLEAVLSAAPNAQALVSSQELIGIGGEHGHAQQSLVSCSTTGRHRRWRRSAAVSTASRWRSRWRPRGYRCSGTCPMPARVASIPRPRRHVNALDLLSVGDCAAFALVHTNPGSPRSRESMRAWTAELKGLIERFQPRFL